VAAISINQDLARILYEMLLVPGFIGLPGRNRPRTADQHDHKNYNAKGERENIDDKQQYG